LIEGQPLPFEIHRLYCLKAKIAYRYFHFIGGGFQTATIAL
jgi:hypothetical protein